MLFKRTPKDVTLNVKLLCDGCGLLNNAACNEHNGCTEDIEIKVIGVPWAKLNYIKSQSISFDENKKTYFDGQFYLNECLKQMIIEAPWGKTDDMFLIQVNKSLGDELEKLIPNPYSESNADSQDYSEIKKG
jgi:hypothetical protein